MVDDKVNTVQGWCNVCGREQNHALLYSHTETERVDVNKGEHPNIEIAEVLKCLGCDALSARHRYQWDTLAEVNIGANGNEYLEVPEDVHYAPPRLIRPKPTWRRDLPSELEPILDEVYDSASRECFRLAAIGLRLLVEVVATKYLGDVDGLESKLRELGKLSLISTLQRDVLVTVVRAGNAAAHRGFRVDHGDFLTMLDSVEALLRVTYCDPHKHKAIRRKVPYRRRPKKVKKP